ncbi:S8 family serine peptidase [Corynebacterium heidelbergense]|uniref:Serine protease n=1 Tax=Corynebacterium heidelbergense TaxID=2055947 RepID=A0A364V766_9CORY|nr:S8 family serine peptidase [Corynebacterium heidelbergense]RAV32510.1 serine protease [Corynebacterium heidelbergense]
MNARPYPVQPTFELAQPAPPRAGHVQCEVPLPGKALPLDLGGGFSGPGPAGVAEGGGATGGAGAAGVSGSSIGDANSVTQRPLNGVRHDLATGRGVKVAVVDTGAAIPGSTGDRDTCILHGTVTASVVRAVAPEADIVSYRTAEKNSPRGEGLLHVAVEAINRAIDDGAKVINVSLVACAETQGLREVVDRAEAEGRIIVAAIGNTGQCQEGLAPYPAHLPSVLAVGAVAPRVGGLSGHPGSGGGGHQKQAAALEGKGGARPGQKPGGPSPQMDQGRLPAEYNLPGPWADIYAPGGPVSGQLDTPDGPITIVGNPEPFIGTSFAAPVVSGTAALMAQAAPHTPPAVMRDILLASAIPGGFTDHAHPVRVIDPSAALSRAAGVHQRQAMGVDPATHSRDVDNLLRPTHPGVGHTHIGAKPVEHTATNYTVAGSCGLFVSLAAIAAVIVRARRQRGRATR